jgi:hypothetical protein
MNASQNEKKQQLLFHEFLKAEKEGAEALLAILYTMEKSPDAVLLWLTTPDNLIMAAFRVQLCETLASYSAEEAASYLKSALLSRVMLLDCESTEPARYAGRLKLKVVAHFLNEVQGILSSN